MMKTIIGTLFFCTVLILMISCKKDKETTENPSTAENFNVMVNHGYGSGTYKMGDTVHIFTNHYTDNQLFDKWTGDASLLNAPNEWHTWFVMPNRNVSLTGSLKNAIPVKLKYEQIMGRDRLKPVYYDFPTGHKGIAYLLHGTGGSADVLVKGYEYQLLIRDLVSNNFGVIITEAEESSTGVDANGDGKIRWALLPADTTANVDYANIRLITESFYKRRLTDRAKPRYAIGMSDGGFFSSALSSV